MQSAGRTMLPFTAPLGMRVPNEAVAVPVAAIIDMRELPGNPLPETHPAAGAKTEIQTANKIYYAKESLGELLALIESRPL